MNAKNYENTNGCIWNYANLSCGISLLTSGQHAYVVGYNFGSSASFVSVLIGTESVKLLYMEDLDADRCGPSIFATTSGSCAGLALMFYEGVSHLGKIFRVVVNDQSSEYPTVIA